MRKYSLLSLLVAGYALAGFAVVRGSEGSAERKLPNSKTNPSETTNASVAKLASLKSRAESWAATIRQDASLDAKTQREGRKYYIAACASVNGWITEYKWELAHDVAQPTSPAFTDAQSRAVEDGQKYVDFVDQVYSKGAISGQGVSLIGMVIDSIKWTITTVATRSSDERKAMVPILDSLQWKPWETLDASRPPVKS